MPAEEAERMARFYDLGHAAQAPAPDIEWFRALASRTGGPVLALACGTGRLAVPLARDGHDVVGVDWSAAMLERARVHAREAGVEIDLVEADVRELSLDRTFALVTMIFNTFLMLPPDDRWVALARVREHLAPGGLFAIDVFQPDPQKIAGYDGGLIEEWSRHDTTTGGRVTEFSSTRATVDRAAFTSRYDEVGPDHVLRRYERKIDMHYLYRREAELLFPAAGFEIEALHGDYDGSPADEGSPRLLVVAGRRERAARDRRRGERAAE